MKIERPRWKVYLRRLFLYFIDSVFCIVAGTIAGLAVFKGYPEFNSTKVISAIGIGIIVQLASMALFGGYRYIFRYSDLIYNIRLVFIYLTIFLLEFLIVGGIFGFEPAIFFSLFQAALSFFFVIVSRFVYQLLIEYRGKQRAKTVGQRIMVIGAGWAGKHVLQDLSRDNEKYYPVCLIDDDFDKHNMLMENVPIVGGMDSIEANVKEYRVDKIIFAIPSAPLEARNKIIARCLATGKEVNILPNMSDLVAQADITSLIRKVKIEDLLQRDEVKFDIDEISDFISGKTCLVTGGGGSIGSELCRQIASFNPEKLIILDIYENSAFDISCELKEKFPSLNMQVEIVSVADEPAMEKLFSEEHINLVFHAAAHKHVPLMEHNPEESVKNNVVGTFVTAKMSAKYNVDKFIMVSTDKAVNPTNVMGATKRFCEKIVGYFGARSNYTSFSATRFGNVLGSNGSVVHTFNRQIAKGGPITVTDPNIIRYFMTIPEAVSLILQAGAFAGGGEVFVLDMGEPVKIADLAENMIRLAGRTPGADIKIEYTGLRPGEKLYEELLLSEEGMQKTPNNKIYIGNQSYICEADIPEKYEALKAAAATNDGVSVIAALQDAVETYTPDNRYHNVRNTDSPAYILSE